MNLAKISQKLRDNLRLLAMQKAGSRAYTVSLEPVWDGDAATTHFACDWNRPTFLKKLQELRVTVDAVTVDHYWMPAGYSGDKLPDHFFEETIPNLVPIIRDGGSLFLPAKARIVDQLLRSKKRWDARFELHLLDDQERRMQCPLFAGINLLEKVVGKENVARVLAKDDSNNEGYTEITETTIRGASKEVKRLCMKKGLPVCLLRLDLKRSKEDV